MESMKDKNGVNTKTIILNDQNATDRIIKDEKVIGFVIAKTEFSFDLNGELKKWRNRFENKIVKKTGPGKTRTLKKDGNVQEFLAVLIEGEKEIQKALSSGWISIFKQGRNSNGDPRPPKYQMHLEKIPTKNIVKL